MEPSQHEHARQQQRRRHQRDSGPVRRQEELVDDQLDELDKAPGDADVDRHDLGHAALQEIAH